MKNIFAIFEFCNVFLKVERNSGSRTFDTLCRTITNQRRHVAKIVSLIIGSAKTTFFSKTITMERKRKDTSPPARSDSDRRCCLD